MATYHRLPLRRSRTGVLQQALESTRGFGARQRERPRLLHGAQAQPLQTFAHKRRQRIAGAAPAVRRMGGQRGGTARHRRRRRCQRSSGARKHRMAQIERRRPLVGRGAIGQDHHQIAQQVHCALGLGDGIGGGRGGHVALHAVQHLHHPAGQQRRATQKRQRAAEQQPATGLDRRPALLGVRHRLGVGQAYQRFGGGSKQPGQWVAALHLFAQLSGRGPGGYAEFIALMKVTDMRFQKPTVGIHRLTARGDPGQHVVLQLARRLDRLQQRPRGFELAQTRREQRAIEQMRPLLAIARADHKVAEHRILGGRGRCFERQRPDRRLLTRSRRYCRGYQARTCLGQPALPLEFHLQGQQWQLRAQLPSKQGFAPCAFGGIADELLLEQVRVGLADVHLGDAGQQQRSAQPSRRGAALEGDLGGCMGKAPEVLQG